MRPNLQRECSRGKQIPRNLCVGESLHFRCDREKGGAVSVEGELRYREFVPKKKQKNGDQTIRVAEIHRSLEDREARPCREARFRCASARARPRDGGLLLGGLVF